MSPSSERRGTGTRKGSIKANATGKSSLGGISKVAPQVPYPEKTLVACISTATAYTH